MSAYALLSIEHPAKGRPGASQGYAMSAGECGSCADATPESDLKPAGGIVGEHFDEFCWPGAARPGDELRVESEVREVQPSKFCGPRADNARTPSLHQDGEAVRVLASNQIVPSRQTR